MQYTEEQKKPFDTLWESYNLPTGCSEYWSLFDRWLGIRAGVYKTTEGLLSDRTALDCARLLLQLRCCAAGVFSMAVGRNEWVEYQNTALVEAMESGLQERLASVVEKADGALILGKGFGGGDTGRAFIIDCPDSNPKEADFSDAELDAIVSFEESTQREVKRLQGYKQKDKGNKDAGKSMLPDMGLTASLILKTLKGMGVSDYRACCFAFDFMLRSGMLDFRIDKGVFENLDNRGKKEYVRNWIKAYKHTRLTLIE